LVKTSRGLRAGSRLVWVVDGGAGGFGDGVLSRIVVSGGIGVGFFFELMYNS